MLEIDYCFRSRTRASSTTPPLPLLLPLPHIHQLLLFHIDNVICSVEGGGGDEEEEEEEKEKEKRRRRSCREWRWLRHARFSSLVDGKKIACESASTLNRTEQLSDTTSLSPSHSRAVDRRLTFFPPPLQQQHPSRTINKQPQQRSSIP